MRAMRRSLLAAALCAACALQAPRRASADGARGAVRGAVREALRENGAWDQVTQDSQPLASGAPTQPTAPPTQSPTAKPEMLRPPEMLRQNGWGGCLNCNASALLNNTYVLGSLEEVKAKSLADARCKVMVYSASGSGLHASCERDPKRLADVWIKVEVSRAGLNLCTNLGGCTWSGGPCQTGPGTCDTSTGRCSSPGHVTDGTSCDDGDLFTSDDRCAYGSCASHERNCLKTPCPASSACVRHSCINPAGFFSSQKSYCVVSYNQGASCDDGDAATPSRVCDSRGTCVAKQVGEMTLPRDPTRTLRASRTARAIATSQAASPRVVRTHPVSLCRVR